jgi:hypothetical protein
MEKKNSYQLFMEEAPEAANAFNGQIGSLQNSGLDSKTVAGIPLMPVTRHQIMRLSDCAKLKGKFMCGKKSNGYV